MALREQRDGGDAEHISTIPPAKFPTGGEQGYPFVHSAESANKVQHHMIKVISPTSFYGNYGHKNSVRLKNHALHDM